MAIHVRQAFSTHGRARAMSQPLRTCLARSFKQAKCMHAAGRIGGTLCIDIPQAERLCIMQSEWDTVWVRVMHLSRLTITWMVRAFLLRLTIPFACSDTVEFR